MAINIKNERVERLIDEITAITGDTKTEAVRRALEERRDRLVRYRGKLDAGARVWRVMEREIWPTIPTDLLGAPLTKEEEDRILGYSPDGA